MYYFMPHECFDGMDDECSIPLQTGQPFLDTSAIYLYTVSKKI